jgi:hypothetical protein
MEGARRRTRTRPAGAPSEQARGAEPHLFVALECDRPLAGAARLRLRALDEVAIGRGQSRRWERLDGAGRLSFDDGWMSAAHAVLRRVLGAWIVEDLGSKNGTLVNGSLVQRAQLADGDLLELGHTFLLFRETVPAPDAPPWTDAAELWPAAPGLATLAPALEVELAQLPAIARSPVSVLVRGETGTGKEVIASAIHGLSGRPGSFVAVNCGALSKTLVESELFGYRKGAFSGADQDRPGLVRSADRGTLFLDEIGDLPATAQAALCARCKSTRCCRSGTSGRRKWTCAWWWRPTATSKRWWRATNFVPTCSRASPDSGSSFLPCGSGAKISVFSSRRSFPGMQRSAPGACTSAAMRRGRSCSTGGH